MLESIYHFDWNVFQFVEAHLWNPVFDAISKVITLSGESGIIWILFALAFLIAGLVRKNDTYKKISVAVVVSLLFMEVANNLVIKELIARVRPFNFNWSQFSWGGEFNYPDIVSKPTSWSFPSGHASSSFAAAVAIFWYDKKKGVPALFYAALLAFSRVYVHVHYCTDIIAGTLVGIIYALIGVLITKLIYDFVEKHIFSKIESKLSKQKE
ncbi:MAG: phosphatase PAP2 family protein [Acutalibacteraceae bacterium]|nr:phosphatase PAP2 family protein [Oscillospiraceae bacterium]